MNFMGLSFCLMTFLLMVSCGDNGEPNPVTINPVTISGIAGTGSTSTAAAKADFFKAANQAVSANSVIPNGAVTIFDKLGKVLGTTTTDANGLFSVDVTPGLDYFIQVVSQDGATAVRSYLANVSSGSANAIVNAFSSTLVFAMEQRLNIKLSDGGFTGTGLSASADQILAAAGFKDLVAKIQADLANGNVTNGLASAQAALTALLEGLPALPSGGTGGTAITISAGSGLTPAYTFDGGPVNSLSVMRTSAPTVVVWGITTPLSDGIASPLTHNTVGNGVVQTFSTETSLTAGVEYRVAVTRLDGSTGFTSFTPSVGDTGGGTGGGTGGSTDTTVFAGTGLTPQYGWAGGGGISSFSVMRTADLATVVWGIETQGSDGITPSITHGTTPTGATQTSSTETTLTAGVEYRAVATRLDGSTGFTVFTPSGGDTGGGTGGGTTPVFTGTLTFTGSGASLVPNGSDPFTFSPDTSNGDAISNPTWVMGSGANHITLDTPRKPSSNKVNLVRIAAGAFSNVHSWVLSDLTNGVAGVVVSITGNVLSFTFTDVQVPEFATGSSTLIINGTITMAMENLNSNPTPPALGSLAFTSDRADLDGITFTPVRVTKETTTEGIFGETVVKLTYLQSPKVGDVHTLIIRQTTGSSIVSLNKSTIGFTRLLSGGLIETPKPFSVVNLDNAEVNIGANVVFTNQVFAQLAVVNGAFVTQNTTLNGTLTVPATDSVLQ